MRGPRQTGFMCGLVLAAVVAMLMLPMAPGAAAEMRFKTVGPLQTESFPTDLVVGDFNRDARADIALGVLRDTCNCGGVEALLNRPGPTLEPRGLFPQDTFAPFYPVVGDFNRDGRDDLAVTGVLDTPPGATAGVLILRGKGDGNFVQKRLYSMNIDTSRAQLGVGDFNRDGMQDLAVTNPDGNVVSVLLAGRHSFHEGVEYPAGQRPRAVAIADFNRDGIQDLAVTDYKANAVSVLLGRGRGRFAAPVAHSVKNHPSSLVAGDFNEDGKRDLATTSYFGGNVSVLLGTGDGDFLAARTHGVGAGAQDLALGDFNRDGHQDLAVTRSGFDNANEGVVILRGTGDGGFRHPLGIAQDTDDCCARIDTADFNRDGTPDLVVDYENNDGPYGPGEVLLLLNAG